jgi:hypothetical protein
LKASRKPPSILSTLQCHLHRLASRLPRLDRRRLLLLRRQLLLPLLIKGRRSQSTARLPDVTLEVLG